MPPVIKTDARQLVHRDLLDQLTTASAHAASVLGGKRADSTQLDDLLTAVNSDLTVPARITASDPANLVLTLDSSVISNTGTSRNRSLYPIDGSVPDFAGSTITFPATSAGNITPSIGSAIPVTTSNGQFNKLGIYINSANEIVLVEGTEGATPLISTAPLEQPGMTYVGYVDFGVDGGGNITDSSSVVGQVINSDIYQYVNASGAGLSSIVNQDRSVKMIGGGDWNWDGANLSWDANAYIQIPGMLDDRNTIDPTFGAQSPVAVGANQVAYVSVNRIDPGVTTDLTVSVVNVDAYVHTNDNVIIARRDGADIIVGTGSFRLISGETRALDASASNENLALLGSGVDESTALPEYSLRGAPERTIDDTQAMLDAMASMDTELDNWFGQLRLQAHPVDPHRATITGVDFTMKDGSTLSKELSSLVTEFTGAIINFDTGEILEDDDVTPLGTNFTPTVISVSDYHWYSVALVPSSQNVATNTMQAQVLVLPATATDPVAADAPYAPFGGTVRLGQVQVQNVAGTITVGSIRQLGIGSGSGTATQDRNAKMIGGGTWNWDGTDLSWSANAYIQVPGMADDRNRIDPTFGAQSPVAVGANQVAYVDINRIDPGVATDLTVSVVDVDTFEQGEDRFVIARRDGADIIVGTSSFRIANGQYLELDGSLQEIRRLNDQLKIVDSAVGNADEVDILGADIAQLDGTTLTQELANSVLSFDGATINFTTGVISGGPIGTNFTPAVIPVGEYHWYSVALTAGVPDITGKITATVEVGVAESSNAVQASALYAEFIGTKKLGVVQVQNNGGTIEVVDIRRLGTGSGSGSGTGDASSILTRLQDTLSDSVYNQLTGIDFAVNADDQVDVLSTGSYSVASGLFEFSGAAETLITTNLTNLDDEEAISQVVKNVQAVVFWDEEAIDTAATYEVSRDIGLTFETITMERVGSTETYIGTHNFDVQPGSSFTEGQLVASSTASLNAGSNGHASKFTLADLTVLNDIRISVNNIVGSPTAGRVEVEIVRDDGGSPSTDDADIVVKTSIAAADVVVGWNILPVSTDPIPAGTYHITILGDADYLVDSAIDTIVLDRDNIPASGLGALTLDGGASWLGGTDFPVNFEIQGYLYGLSLRVTSSAESAIAGYGVYYDQDAILQYGEAYYQEAQFQSNSAPTNFTLNWIPDPELLFVKLKETGQSFSLASAGDTNGFTVSGFDVIFPAGTFTQLVDESFTLVFQQSSGSVDNSDSNANKIATLEYGTRYAIVSSDTTLLTRPINKVAADTSGMAIQVDLPASPVLGDVVQVADAQGTFSVNNLTMDGNGNNILGAATFTVSTDYANPEFVWVGGANGWTVRV